MNPSISERFVELGGKNQLQFDFPASKPTPILGLFKTPLLRRFIFGVSFTALATGLLNFGYTFHVDSLAGSVYLNVMVMGLANVLSPTAILIVDRMTAAGLKRKLTHTVCVSALLIFTFGIILTKTVIRSEVAVRVLSFSACSVSLPLWTVTNLITNEHFPTKLRNQANGFAHIFAYGGGIAAPFVLYTAKIWEVLPYAIFAIFATLNLWVVRKFLLETRGKRLPEDVDFESNEAAQRWILEHHDFSRDIEVTTEEKF